MKIKRIPLLTLLSAMALAGCAASLPPVNVSQAVGGANITKAQAREVGQTIKWCGVAYNHVRDVENRDQVLVPWSNATFHQKEAWAFMSREGLTTAVPALHESFDLLQTGLSSIAGGRTPPYWGDAWNKAAAANTSDIDQKWGAPSHPYTINGPARIPAKQAWYDIQLAQQGCLAVVSVMNPYTDPTNYVNTVVNRYGRTVEIPSLLLETMNPRSPMYMPSGLPTSTLREYNDKILHQSNEPYLSQQWDIQLGFAKLYQARLRGPLRGQVPVPWYQCFSGICNLKSAPEDPPDERGHDDLLMRSGY